jgi:hypothetical protein
MFVLNKPGLSMYSNWKVVSKDSHPSGLTPRQSLDSYNTSYGKGMSHSGVFTLARNKDGSGMIMAHSSEWCENKKKARKAISNDETADASRAKSDNSEAGVITSADVSVRYRHLPCSKSSKH